MININKEFNESNCNCRTGSVLSGLINGPLRHNTMNGNYFTDTSNKAIYLTGSHTWFTLQDHGKIWPPEPFDFDGYLDTLKSCNHNFFRLWAWENTCWMANSTDKEYFEPMLYIRSGPDEALDGAPRFDLDNFNEEYFKRMRSRIIKAGERDIYVGVMLFQGFSLDNKTSSDTNAWKGHPFNASNNINGVDGDIHKSGYGNDMHTLNAPDEIIERQKIYIRKVIDTVNDLDNVLYEISNEENGSEENTEWQYSIINYIKEYEETKSKTHPVIMSFQWPGGNNDDLFNSPADAVCPGTDNYVSDMPEADGKKVILLDSDHCCALDPRGDGDWVWKSFLRGLNPILMDDLTSSEYWYVYARQAMGNTLKYARRMNLLKMKPSKELASTEYCMADPGQEYLVFQPENGLFTLELCAGAYEVEWFEPKTESIVKEGDIKYDEGLMHFSPPFSESSILYLKKVF